MCQIISSLSVFSVQGCLHIFTLQEELHVPHTRVGHVLFPNYQHFFLKNKHPEAICLKNSKMTYKFQ